MAKIEPKRFVAESRDGHVKMADVAVHQEIRSDRDGHSHQYIRVSGAVRSDLDDFETITVDVDFALFDGDENIGALSLRELTIRSKDEAVSFEPNDALQVPVSANVTKIDVTIDATVVSKSKGTIELSSDD